MAAQQGISMDSWPDARPHMRPKTDVLQATKPGLKCKNRVGESLRSWALPSINQTHRAYSRNRSAQSTCVQGPLPALGNVFMHQRLACLWAPVALCRSNTESANCRSRK